MSKEVKPKSPLAKLVIDGAKLRFGATRWQSPLAKIAKVSPATIQKLVSEADQRDVTAVTAHAVAVALIVEADKMEADSVKIREIAMKILSKLEGK